MSEKQEDHSSNTSSTIPPQSQSQSQLQSQSQSHPPPTKSMSDPNLHNHDNAHDHDDHIPQTCYRSGGIQFAGRLGGNQDFVLDRKNPADAALLRRLPDAAPYMTVRQSLDLHGFAELEIWKAALMEGWGTMMLAYLTLYISISPATLPAPPTERWGPYNNASFVGPLVGGLTNWILLTLFTYAFSPVSGAHLNPTISIATFCARLTSLPRMTLYVGFQTAGGALAGLLLRASHGGGRDFKVGGCFLFPQLVPVGSAFVVEFVAAMALLFLAFGVGLDPRQRQVFGPALGPVFVGAVLAVLSFGTAFSRYGYGGASLNPARCFGAFVGSRFPSWHWVHWVGPIAASVVHGFFYFVVPPWTYSRPPARASMGRAGMDPA